MKPTRFLLACALAASTATTAPAAPAASAASDSAPLGDVVFDREYADALALIRGGRQLEAAETLRALRDDIDRLPVAKSVAACRRLLAAFRELGIPEDLRPGLARLMPDLELDIDLEALGARLAPGGESKAYQLFRSSLGDRVKADERDRRLAAALDHLDDVTGITDAGRYLRGLCHLHRGDLTTGVREMSAHASARPAAVAPRLVLSRLAAFLGNPGDGQQWLVPPAEATASAGEIRAMVDTFAGLESRGDVERATTLAAAWMERLPAGKDSLELGTWVTERSLQGGDSVRAWTTASRFLATSPGDFGDVDAFHRAGRALAKRSSADRLQVIEAYRTAIQGGASGEGLPDMVARLHLDGGEPGEALRVLVQLDPALPGSAPEERLVAAADRMVRAKLAEAREVVPGLTSTVFGSPAMSAVAFHTASDLYLQAEQLSEAGRLFRQGTERLRTAAGRIDPEAIEDRPRVMGVASRLFAAGAIETGPVMEVTDAILETEPEPAPTTQAFATRVHLIADQQAGDEATADEHFFKAARYYAGAAAVENPGAELAADLKELQGGLVNQAVLGAGPGMVSDGSSSRARRITDTVARVVVDARLRGGAITPVVSLAAGASMHFSKDSWSRLEQEEVGAADPSDADMVRFLRQPEGSLPPRENLARHYVTGQLARFFEDMRGVQGFLPGPDNTRVQAPAGDVISRARDRVMREGMTEEGRFARVMNVMPEFADPIVLDLDGSGTLDLTASRADAVSFDLGGMGAVRRVQWLAAGRDGWLCEDAGGDGRIASGHELFGSAGGFAHGFVKLGLRDTDHDRVVRGRELDGLSVWIDGDGDGVSDDGELVSLASLGIESLEVPVSGLRSSFVRNGRRAECWDAFPQVY